MIIIAISGWVLFIFGAILYRAGNKLNAQETVALSAFSLAILLSDEFRSATRQGIEKSIRENAPSSNPNELVYAMMSAITRMAKDYIQNKGVVNPLALALQIVEKLKNST